MESCHETPASFALLLAIAAGTARARRGTFLAGKGIRCPAAGGQAVVYWFWLNSNITREGITADLEAMKRVGTAAC